MGLPMVGERHRRETNSQERAARNLGRIPERVQGASSSGRSSLNHQRKTPRQQLKEITIATLIQHYREHEMPYVFSKKRPSIGTVCEHEEGRKSYSTQETYEGYLKKWIGPMGILPARRCQSSPGGTVVENRASGTGQQGKDQKYHERLVQPRDTVGMDGQESNHASSSERQTLQDIRPSCQWKRSQRLFSCIKEPCRTAVILDAVRGLRVGELLGLKWEDVKFDQLELKVTRSVSRQVVTPCKTEVSRKPIPMNVEIAEMLWRWRQEAPYNQPEDWVFGKSSKKGKPTVLAQLAFPGAPAACTLNAGHYCSGRLAPSPLRHTFGTLMKANGESQDHPRTPPPCQLQSHSRRLHASGHASEARRLKPVARQIMADGSASGGEKDDE